MSRHSKYLNVNSLYCYIPGDFPPPAIFFFLLGLTGDIILQLGLSSFLLSNANFVSFRASRKLRKASRRARNAAKTRLFLDYVWFEGKKKWHSDCYICTIRKHDRIGVRVWDLYLIGEWYFIRLNMNSLRARFSKLPLRIRCVSIHRKSRRLIDVLHIYLSWSTMKLEHVARMPCC